MTAGKADDEAFLKDLNSRLAKYNIEFKHGMLCFAFFYLLLRRKNATFFLFLESVFSTLDLASFSLTSFFLLSLYYSSLITPAGKGISRPNRFNSEAC